jgi:AmmeMemoRadiSam system protein B
MLRLPAVAGRFYPVDPRELTREVQKFTAGIAAEEKIAARGCVVPHAGYMYSGAVAGAVYGRLRLPQRLILLGPRHYPQGAALAILSEGAWQTPLGQAQVDEILAREIRQSFPALQENAVAHHSEHALEVQLPFLQLLAGDFRFVPIALGPVAISMLEDLGRAIANAVREVGGEVLLVASSDMNHYESAEVTRAKDHLAIQRMLALDPRGLYDTVRREPVSMCGYGPAVVMLTAALELGATRAELVQYATSGDVTGDRDEVVGYAGIIVN